jgi:hypothetical protein
MVLDQLFARLLPPFIGCFDDFIFLKCGFQQGIDFNFGDRDWGFRLDVGLGTDWEKSYSSLMGKSGWITSFAIYH